VAAAVPVYREFEGWPGDIGNVREYAELPGPARDYVEFIEEYTGVPVDMIGVGAAREQCVVRRRFFAQ